MTHGGEVSRAVIRSISARSPTFATVRVCKMAPGGGGTGLKTQKPRFAVWGGRMNLRKQVEPLLSAALQASSEQRHAQHATSRLAWLLHRLRRASETITS